MPSLCPTCGQQIAPLELFVCLNSDTANRLGKTIRLTPAQAVLLHTLNASPLQRLSTRDLGQALYGRAGITKSEVSSLSNIIRRLRVKIAAIAVRVENIRDKRGYQILLDAPIEKASHRQAA